MPTAPLKTMLTRIGSWETLQLILGMPCWDLPLSVAAVAASTPFLSPVPFVSSPLKSCWLDPRIPRDEWSPPPFYILPGWPCHPWTDPIAACHWSSSKILIPNPFYSTHLLLPSLVALPLSPSGFPSHCESFPSTPSWVLHEAELRPLSSSLLYSTYMHNELSTTYLPRPLQTSPFFPGCPASFRPLERKNGLRPFPFGPCPFQLHLPIPLITFCLPLDSHSNTYLYPSWILQDLLPFLALIYPLT